jgi:hypothetical protein
MKQNELIETFDEDFGLTFMDPKDLQPDVYKEKLVKLHKMILPLLKNLMKDPDKEVIHWPDRKKRIEKFMKDMDRLLAE